MQKTNTRFAAIKKLIPPRSVAFKLNLTSDNPVVIQLKRVRFLKDNPFSFITNYLPLEIGSKIVEEDLYKKSLLDILENRPNSVLNGGFKQSIFIYNSLFYTMQAL